MKNISNIIIIIFRFLLNNKYSSIILRFIPYIRLILIKIIITDNLINKIRKMENYNFKEIIKLIIYFIFNLIIYILAVIGLSFII